MAKRLTHNTLIIGNWKMNGDTARNEVLLSELLPALSNLKGVDVVVCPPLPYLSQVAHLLAPSNVVLGAQNLNHQTAGAHTGETSAGMLVDLGCHYVLVGHSERRAFHGEHDEWVAAKFAAALGAGMVPVLCVGETFAQRQVHETESVVTSQLNAVLQRVGIDQLCRGVIAYEPVWAIGTGETASPEQAQAVHQHIRQWLTLQNAKQAADCRILYGGSVNARNAEKLFSQPDIDGGLIGGASLDATSFIAVCVAAQR